MSKTAFQPINRIFSEDLMLGLSKESETSLENYKRIYFHYYVPLSRSTYQQEFYDLLLNWRGETRHLSLVADIAMHPSYQKIIGMGEKVVPLLLRELQKKPEHLFWALKAITGADPIQPSQRGKLKEMAQTWLTWATENGYQW